MIAPDFEALSDAVRGFRPRCAGCSPESVIAADAHPCSFYGCPGLPKELEVTCNTCMFDFAAQDGQPSCDHRTCDTALRLQGNVETCRMWVQLLAEEVRAVGHS